MNPCLCRHVEHDRDTGECYTSGCKCRHYVMATDHPIDVAYQAFLDARDEGVSNYAAVEAAVLAAVQRQAEQRRAFDRLRELEDEYDF